jgi:hypothetical protein
LVAVIAPPLLTIGPAVDVEMIWSGPEHAACAGAAKTPSAISDAPARSAARDARPLPLHAATSEEPSTLWPRPPFLAPMARSGSPK